MHSHSPDAAMNPRPDALPSGLRTLLRAFGLLSLLLLPPAIFIQAAAPYVALDLDEAVAEDETSALDEYFNAKVSLDGKTVTLKYDFRDKKQMRDFKDRVPWPIERRDGQKIAWYDEKLEVVGNSGARHVAEWKDTVQVKVTVTVDNDRDIGAWLSPSNGNDDYATFTLTEHFFHTWNGKTGGTNSIIKFGKQWRERGSSNDFIGFRYVSRKPPRPKLAVGDTKTFTFGLHKRKLTMTQGDMELKGNDRGKKLKTFFVGFYAIEGRAMFDNIEMTGVLNPEWLDHEKIDLRVNVSTAAGGGLDEETQAWIEQHKAGKARSTRKLVKLVADTGVERPTREALIKVLSAGPKAAARQAQDLLYSKSEEVRTDGIAIIKALVGKDWGYKPKASEGARSKAIQQMNEDLTKNPSLLEG